MVANQMVAMCLSQHYKKGLEQREMAKWNKGKVFAAKMKRCRDMISSLDLQILLLCSWLYFEYLFKFFYFIYQTFIWETRLGEDRIPDRGLILIQNITENRLRHASGPVQNTDSVTFIPRYTSWSGYTYYKDKSSPGCKLCRRSTVSVVDLQWVCTGEWWFWERGVKVTNSQSNFRIQW